MLKGLSKKICLKTAKKYFNQLWVVQHLKVDQKTQQYHVNSFQANWEREARQRRASAAGAGTPDGEGSSVDSILSCAGPPKAALAFGSNLLSTPILRSGSCTRIFPDSSEEEVATADEDQLPPPPSPPCTCGKNLELPPTPPPGNSYLNLQPIFRLP